MSAASPEPVVTVPCPVCGHQIPDGSFCAACGSSLRHEGRASADRTHSYTAAPNEHVIHLSFVSTMFPHLSHRARQPFRIGFAFLVVALLALAAGHLEGPVIAVSALGVPLLFALYLYEVDVYEDEPVRTLALTVGLGAALGVGWTLLTDHLVTTAVRTNLLGGPMPSSGTWHSIAAVFVPVGGQLLMVVPVLVMRIRTRLRPDSLDGFVHGAAGALGFAVAATLVELTPQLGNGVIVGTGGVGSIIAEAIIHGLTVPVLAASATGLIGAALWVNRRAINGRSGRWLTSFATAAVLALIVQAGLGFTDVDAPGTGVVLTAHIAAAAAFLVALRIGLHHVLLHEAHDVVIGPPRICHHCHHVVPSAPFCAHCGAAQVATTPSARTGLVAAAAGASAGEGGGAS